jgi:hypothetical protein
VLDQPNAESDRRLGRHLVSLYYDDDVQLQAQQSRAGNVDQVWNLEITTLNFNYHNIDMLMRINSTGLNRIKSSQLKLIIKMKTEN